MLIRSAISIVQHCAPHVNSLPKTLRAKPGKALPQNLRCRNVADTPAWKVSPLELIGRHGNGNLNDGDEHLSIRWVTT